MKLTIFTTMTEPTKRQDAWKEAVNSYLDLADEVLLVIGDKDLWHSEDSKEIVSTWNKHPRIKVMYHVWDEEFNWSFIGEQFQRGYEAAEGDWVIRADLDYIFHEKDIDRIRTMLNLIGDAPAASFWKYQFLLVDRYQIKSRPVIAMNKLKYGDRIKLNGGGDLCQPTLDGELITSESVPEIKCPIYNYDFCFKSEKIIRKDFQRFSRAWFKTFGEYTIGGPDEESAFQYFKQMMVGRFLGRGHEQIDLSAHPRYIQERIKHLESDRFGYSMFGWVGETAKYYTNN